MNGVNVSREHHLSRAMRRRLGVSPFHLGEDREARKLYSRLALLPIRHRLGTRRLTWAQLFEEAYREPLTEEAH